jgi:ABC-type proline/glycine betaine transport system permease subunit
LPVFTICGQLFGLKTPPSGLPLENKEKNNMTFKNRKVKRQKRKSGELNTCSHIALVILSCSFAIFLAVAILVAIFKPDLLDRISEYAADFCKVTLGAVLGWLLHRGRGP